jgi:hypothetical protein
VQKLRIDPGGRRKRAQCDLERRFEPLRGGGSDGFGGKRGKRVTYQLDGLADEVGEPAGEARMLKRLDGPAQGFTVLDGDVCGFLQRQF